MLLIQVLAFLVGAAIVAFTVFSAIETFVLPRSANDPLTRFVFVRVNGLFRLWTKRSMTYEERDRRMAFFAPVALLVLPPVWLILVMIGYTGMFWAIGVPTLRQALVASGSSLLTLGFASLNDLGQDLLAFTEATIGLMLIAVLIAYLPTIYGSFQRRELQVTMLEVRAGSPPSALQMIERYQRIHGLDRLSEEWTKWEQWFADIEESHTSLGTVSFFRSPRPEHSWVTAAGTILDAAALTLSSVDIPPTAEGALCLRAGYLALRHIADFFRIPFDPNPKPDDPISISRSEFDAAYDELKESNVPVKADRDQCWRDFNGWRVNYDTVLLALASLTMAPYAPWISDRSLRKFHLPS